MSHHLSPKKRDRHLAATSVQALVEAAGPPAGSSPPAACCPRSQAPKLDAVKVQPHHEGTTTALVPLATLFLTQARMPLATLATRAQRWPRLSWLLSSTPGSFSAGQLSSHSPSSHSGVLVPQAQHLVPGRAGCRAAGCGPARPGPSAEPSGRSPSLAALRPLASRGRRGAEDASLLP